MAKSTAGPIAALLVIGLALILALGATAFERGPDQPGASIRGRWALVGEENVTFVILRDSIYYPDHGASYKYTLVRDSLHIRYDGFDGNYLVKLRGADTLILVGDEQSVYYRFKK